LFRAGPRPICRISAISIRWLAVWPVDGFTPGVRAEFPRGAVELNNRARMISKRLFIQKMRLRRWLMAKARRVVCLLRSARGEAICYPTNARTDGAVWSGSRCYSPWLTAILGRTASALIKAVLGLTVFAVGLARMAPHEAAEPPMPVRTPALPAVFAAWGEIFDRAPRWQGKTDESVLLDPDSGRQLARISATMKKLYRAIGSPWRDAEGRSRLAGVISGEVFGQNSGPALVDVSLPDGAIVASIPLETGMFGSPCWFPDGSERVLFVDARNCLYRVDFADTQRPPIPISITWRNDSSYRNHTLTGDLMWPAEPRLGNRILAAMCEPAHSDGAADRRRWLLYWLELNEDQTEIVDVQPLLAPSAASSDDTVKRWPVAGVNASGNIVVAYLEQGRHDPIHRYRLRLISLKTSPKSATLTARCEDVRTVAENCAGAHPVFSADGRWVSFLPWPEKSNDWQLRRVSTDLAPISRNLSGIKSTMSLQRSETHVSRR
jgi:hypothetical protein